MSAEEPPTPAELEQQFGITAQQAQAVANGLAPVRKIADAGAGIGGVLADAPGAGPKFMGIILQNVSTHVELTATNAETIARAIEFYIDTQTQGFEEVFPPPQELLRQVDEDVQPLAEALTRDRT